MQPNKEAARPSKSCTALRAIPVLSAPGREATNIIFFTPLVRRNRIVTRDSNFRLPASHVHVYTCVDSIRVYSFPGLSYMAIHNILQ